MLVAMIVHTLAWWPEKWVRKDATKQLRKMPWVLISALALGGIVFLGGMALIRPGGQNMPWWGVVLQAVTWVVLFGGWMYWFTFRHLVRGLRETKEVDSLEPVEVLVSDKGRLTVTTPGETGGRVSIRGRRRDVARFSVGQQAWMITPAKRRDLTTVIAQDQTALSPVVVRQLKAKWPEGYWNSEASP